MVDLSVVCVFYVWEDIVGLKYRLEGLGNYLFFFFKVIKKNNICIKIFKIFGIILFILNYYIKYLN